ncbi:exonuclease SbcCD subunit D [Jatrophihabitans sp. YIM 134969]
MRIVHTSDWHLGRSLHRADLRSAQEQVLEALVATVRSEAVDLVVVAGDVFDRAIPPLEAVEVFEHALVELRAAGATVVVSSGNHDSAIRLGAHAPLIAAGGVHLRTRVGGLDRPVVVEDRHGPVGVYAIPYLEPAAVAHLLPGVEGEAPRGHAGVVGHAAARIAADAARQGLTRTVVAAHAWVTGGAASDSERDLTVGGVGHVPAEVFAPFGYAALGHLHGAQQVGPTVRYSGSPLAYSFSEARHRKGWYLVELDAAGVAHVDQVAAPVPRGLAEIRGPLADLLTSRAHDTVQQHWLAVTVTDPARPVDAMERLRARFPHVLTLAWEPAERTVDDLGYGARVRHRSDLEIAAGFVEHVRHSAADADECALFGEAFEAVRAADHDVA